MALSHTDLIRTVVGNKRMVVTETSFDSSYPTGGEAITAANLGLQEIQAVVILGTQSNAASARVFVWDRTNSKLMAYNPAAGHTHTENTAASYTQNATTASSTAAAAGEVANTTDLSAVKVNLLVFGI